MKRFAKLFYDLDQTNKTNDKVDVLVNYLNEVPDEDKLQMLALFTGRRPKRVVNSTFLRTWAAEFAGIPLWLFEESYGVVGDQSETIALVLPDPQYESDYSLSYWMEYMRSLDKKNEEERKAAILSAWNQLDRQERFVFNKLSSSTFRVGVSQNLLIRGLSIHTKIPVNVIAHRLMGKWEPGKITFTELLLSADIKEDLSKPYPFYLAYALDADLNELGEPREWQAEWKWDGIRSQLIHREGNLFIWSRGEELITDKFPELELLKANLPDGCVIDGEILPYVDGRLLAFNALQTRIGRKNLTPKILKETPVLIFAYDLLEYKGEDIRERPIAERRQLLESLVAETDMPQYLQLSPIVDFNSWEELAEQRMQARMMQSEGIMLKRASSVYGTGRKRGDWWKWKTDPLSIDAVMIYAMRGTGRRANLYTDYTFGIWKGKELVTIAKAYSGLTDKEIIEVDKWVKENTVEKFGPVRTVKPELVFEIGFEGIQRSSRHKSGIALRFPRMLRWRKDKLIEEADSIETVSALLKMYENIDKVEEA